MAPQQSASPVRISLVMSTPMSVRANLNHIQWLHAWVREMRSKAEIMNIGSYGKIRQAWRMARYDLLSQLALPRLLRSSRSRPLGLGLRRKGRHTAGHALRVSNLGSEVVSRLATSQGQGIHRGIERCRLGEGRSLPAVPQIRARSLTEKRCCVRLRLLGCLSCLSRRLSLEFGPMKVFGLFVCLDESTELGRRS